MKQFIKLSGKVLRRGYALLFAFVFIFYIGMSVLPARLMADGHRSAASVIYQGFRFLCHQYPWRSWFLYGKQPYYPLYSHEQTGMLSFEKAAGVSAAGLDPGHFYGTAEMGYKMAVCQRDFAIYAAMALFCLIFFLSRNRIQRLDWRVWLICGVLPMAVDGIWQLASRLLTFLAFRESTPFLRTVTGALFGFFTCWYLLPTLEKMLREGANDACQ